MNTTTTALREVSGCPFSGHRRPASTTAWSPMDRMAHDGPVIDAIDRWTETPTDGLTLARLITTHVRTIGKHFLSQPILARLARIRDEQAGRDRFLDAFLDGVLDKFEGRYGNRTYLALPLLEQLCSEPGVDADTMSAALMSDVVRFETEAAGASDAPSDLARRKRMNHARRFVELCGRDGLDARRAGPAGEWFDLTVLPVYVAHDEYFFIRALQAHEMVFAMLASDIEEATVALRRRSADEAIARLDHANRVFARAATLFRLVATMRPDHFHTFREYTQGASAIQSEAYKRFEVACGRPSDDRLASEAFTNVPRVQAAAFEPHDDLSQAYLEARRAGAFTQAEWETIDTRLGDLEAAHQRWKITHHSLAVRMLGELTGSGYSSGVPYLRSCLTNRLFRTSAVHLDGSQMA